MKYLISPEGGTVTLLYDYGIGLHDISKWCQEQNWNCVHYLDMRGSEADVIIMYDIECKEMEPYSRAKNALIILQK